MIIKKIMNLIKKTLLIFCVILISFFTIISLTEFLLKSQFGLGKPLVYESHNLWGYSPRENSKYLRFKEKFEITINDVGLRSKNNWNDNRKKILFLGDSVTYGGSYLNDDQTFPLLVCKKLSDFDCFNGGVNGYGILNMVARSKYDKRISDAEVFVFTFINDDFNRGLNKSDTAHFILRDPPKFFPATWEILNFIASKINPKFWFGKKELSKKDTKKIFEEISLSRKFALEIFISEIQRLISLNKIVLLVHSPSINEVREVDLLNNEIIDKIEKKFSNNFLLLEKEFLSIEEIKLNKIFRDNVHYNLDGHKFVSKAILKKLKSILE